MTASRIDATYTEMDCKFGIMLHNSAPGSLTFVIYPDMPPTNNISVRTLRPIVLYKKIRKVFCISGNADVQHADDMPAGVKGAGQGRAKIYTRLYAKPRRRYKAWTASGVMTGRTVYHHHHHHLPPPAKSTHSGPGAISEASPPNVLQGTKKGRRQAFNMPIGQR